MQIKRANPDALYCCDPVIGDRAGGAYVRPGLAAFFRDRALAEADLATPNHFELEQLTERRIASLRRRHSSPPTLLRKTGQESSSSPASNVATRRPRPARCWSSRATRPGW